MSDSVTFDLSAGLIAMLPVVLMGGIFSGFNPCCLPAIPTVAVLMSQGEAKSRWSGFLVGAFFVIGFSIATAILGAITAFFGIIFGQFGSYFNYAMALVLALMGLSLLGIIPLSLPSIPKSKFDQLHTGAFVTGLVFPFVVIPCSTPILASVLTYAATTKNVWSGFLLLFVYGFGAGVPIILMASVLGWSKILVYVNRYRAQINRVTGLALIVAGFYFAWLA